MFEEPAAGRPTEIFLVSARAIRTAACISDVIFVLDEASFATALSNQ